MTTEVTSDVQEIVQKNSRVSIHPRVVNGRTIYTKINTCKPHKGGGKLAKKMKNLNRRRLDHSSTIRTGNTTAYKIPGSMNQGK